MKDGKSSQCIFCGKEKNWMSYMTIQVGDATPIGFTVCPEDRNHTIEELYQRVIVVAQKQIKGDKDA
jgi:hypothetical protein